MQSEIELRYLDLEWLERGRTRRVEITQEPLEVERSTDGSLRIETQIFSDFHPWLGLRLSGGLAESQPAFVDAQGNSRPMLAVDAGVAGVWWVQDDGWDPVKQRHLSELHRTMGRFEVRVGGERLLIENMVAGIGKAQIDEYLQDFKNDLLWLVLGTGAGTASGQGTPLAKKLGAALSRLLKYPKLAGDDRQWQRCVQSV